MSLTFLAEAGGVYTLSLHDVDFAGDRSYVYRLSIAAGPQLLASIPAALQRGTTRQVEIVGLGVATGASKLESTLRQVSAPGDAALTRFDSLLDWPAGYKLPLTMPLSALAETVEPPEGAAAMPPLAAPLAVTGILDRRYGEDRYQLSGKEQERWSILAKSHRLSGRLDLSVTLFGPDGVELARGDDLPGTTDAGLDFTVPKEGIYQLAVADSSSHGGDRSAVYRLTVEPLKADFEISVPANLNVPIGGKTPLPITARRFGGFNEAIAVAISGLPPGIQAAGELVIPAGKNDLPLELTCAETAAATAGLVSVTASAVAEGQPIQRAAGSLLVATVLKPRALVHPEGKDDVRKVHRGSTFPAPVLIERLPGFTGEVTLEMTSKQQRHRQGLTGPELPVPPEATRVNYPIFVPEWMESTKTSRMILNAVVKTPDPQGNVRYSVSKMELRIGVLPGGALLKLSTETPEMQSRPGEAIEVPLHISRAPELKEPVTLELRLQEELAGLVSAEPLVLSADQTAATFRLATVADLRLAGERQFTIRATSHEHGTLEVVSETTVLVTFPPVE